jgi:hypothetical protein
MQRSGDSAGERMGDRMKARLLLLVCALVPLVVLTGCVDSDPYNLKDLPKTQTEPASQTSDTAAPAKLAPSKLGQPASAGTWLLVANKADRAPVAGGVEAKRGKTMLVVTADITNGGALDQDTHPDYFVLVGPDGTRHQVVESEDPAFLNTKGQPVIAGEQREIFLLFSVDEAGGPYELNFLPMTEEGATEPAVIEIP